MRYKRLKLSAIVLLGLGIMGLQAQEAIPASGGNASGSGGSVSYSVGQLVYTTNTGTNGTVAQGVQQPFEISVITGFEEEAIGINLSNSVYPNPTSDFVKLRIENYKTENLIYQLYDINGKNLETEKIESNEARIFMSNYAPAIYFLKVLQGNKEIKTFKIIKN